MSSLHVGEQAHIKTHSSLAVYVHCCTHVLNPVTVHSCFCESVRNTIDTMEQVFKVQRGKGYSPVLFVCIIRKPVTVSFSPMHFNYLFGMGAKCYSMMRTSSTETRLTGLAPNRVTYLLAMYSFRSCLTFNLSGLSF